MAKDVLIVMTSYNRQDLMAKSIDSIIATTTVPYTLHVVDNGSKDGSAEYLKKKEAECPNLKVTYLEKNIGKGAAVNLGFKGCEDYSYLASTDCDIGFSPRWFEILTECAKYIGKWGLLAPNNEAHCFNPHFVFGQRLLPNNFTFVRHKVLAGGMWMVSKELYHHMNGKLHREDRLYGFEDVWLNIMSDRGGFLRGWIQELPYDHMQGKGEFAEKYKDWDQWKIDINRHWDPSMNYKGTEDWYATHAVK